MTNSEISLKERLSKITIDPLCKTSVTRDIMLQIQRNKNYNEIIREEIQRMLKETYSTIGLWGQNPSSELEDFGVLDKDGNWDLQNLFDTNYSCHEILFNRCNLFLLNLYRKRGIENIEISGEIFSYKNPIIIDHDVLKNEEETIKRINKLLKIINHFKEKIFLPENEIFDILYNTCKKTMLIGDVFQEFYVKNINDFFNDIVLVKEFGGLGNYIDRKKGIDVHTEHIDGNILTHQIKGTCDIITSDDGYLINASISKDNKCNFFVFVCKQERIIVLRNNSNQMKFNDNGVFFPKKLKIDDRNYK